MQKWLLQFLYGWEKKGVPSAVYFPYFSSTATTYYIDGAREFIVCDEACAVVASMIPDVDPYCFKSFLMALYGTLLRERDQKS